MSSSHYLRHHFETALSFDPELATTYRYLSMLEVFAFGRVDQGIKHLRRAQALNPGRPDYPLQLARHWDWLGRIRSAACHNPHVTRRP